MVKLSNHLSEELQYGGYRSDEGQSYALWWNNDTHKVNYINENSILKMWSNQIIMLDFFNYESRYLSKDMEDNTALKPSKKRGILWKCDLLVHFFNPDMRN